MLIVYRAANIADAHLIRQLLEAEGVPAFIPGEYLQGAVGELPANSEILVRVADENAEAAQIIIDEWESAEPVEFDADGSEVGGPGAGEPQAGDPQADGSGSLAIEKPLASSPSAGRSVSMLWVIGALFFGGAFGAAATWVILQAPQPPSEIDLDGDGRSDEFYYYFGARVERIETDRNRDGEIDQTQYYDADTSISRSESDDDFDGRMDGRARYSGGQVIDNEIDLDGDGRAEYRAEYRFGLLLREEFMGADGILFKRVEYKNGWAQTDQIDGDGDGRLDTARRYDRNDEIVASEPLPLK